MTFRCWKISAPVIVLAIITYVLVGAGNTVAKVAVPDGSTIEVDEPTFTSVVAMFKRADQAVKSRQLDDIMSFYSSRYNYHGMNKDAIRKVWEELFEEYQEIASTHLLTRFNTVGSGSQAVMEITCTGHLWARSKTSGLYVPIDSWYEEVHYLVLEGGEWRIRGNLGDVPRTLPFGTSPHPLF